MKIDLPAPVFDGVHKAEQGVEPYKCLYQCFLLNKISRVFVYHPITWRHDDSWQNNHQKLGIKKEYRPSSK
jgi:hypothetical protein